MKLLPPSLRKDIRALHSRKGRDGAGAFLVEGKKCVWELLRSDFHAECVVIESGKEEENHALLFAAQGIDCYNAPPSVIEHISDTSSPQGIIAVAAKPTTVLPHNPPQVSLLLDGINDPGNAGTMLRTAHWFGIRAIIAGEGTVDWFHPKTVRATMGSLFHCDVYHAPLTEYLDSLPESILTLGASVHASVELTSIAPPESFALVIGSESHGMASEVEQRLRLPFVIGGVGDAESLNAAVAAGISMYHLTRSLA
ncbi:MAG: RNA methyltransferase [Candidatus Kapabacteria bacterium]|nr:RNA methyltransferase [Candidatus Kapabacteria bacterium]